MTFDSSNTPMSPMSPIRDLKGDATVHIVSTPAFLSTPSDIITPAKLFPTPSVEVISPSSLRFSTPHYKQHFSSFLEPTPSAPVDIVKEFRWMTPSVELLTSTLSSASSSDSDSAHSNSATGSLSESSSSESLQFKWSQTP
jgi:hypothetical protein